ncbi:MAG: DUF3848 domain-containing protein [Ruminococcus sp.]|nr:DUF3848 domain-containing protein [Ruminococcus sp.]
MSKYEQAVDKVHEELFMYKENLLLKSPEEIYGHSFETVIKEEAAEIFTHFSDDSFSNRQLDAVLNAESFLDEVCDAFYSGSQDLNSMSLLLCETIDEMVCEQTVYDKETERE